MAPIPLERDATQRLLSGLGGIVHGVIEMSDKVPGLVATSNNWASIALTESSADVLCLTRSSKPGGGETCVAMQLSEVARSGGRGQIIDMYEGWEPEPDSDLLSITLQAHERVMGRNPKIIDIHAGLECGPFKRQRPDLHMISFGPDITGAHTPRECVGVESVAAVWEILLDVVKKAAAFEVVDRDNGANADEMNVD
jgi:dipeptidase D